MEQIHSIIADYMPNRRYASRSSRRIMSCNKKKGPSVLISLDDLTELFDILDKSLDHFLGTIKSDKFRLTMVGLVRELYVLINRFMIFLEKHMISCVANIVVGYVVQVNDSVKKYISLMTSPKYNGFSVRVSIVSGSNTYLIPFILGQRCKIHRKTKCYKCVGVKWCINCGEYFILHRMSNEHALCKKCDNKISNNGLKYMADLI